MKTSRINCLIVGLFLFFTNSVKLFGQSQDVVKLMVYNILNYADGSDFSNDTAIRNPEFRIIMQAQNPDLVVVGELNSQNGYTAFLNNVMNSGTTQFGAATYVNSFDTDQGLYYRLSKFQFISNTPILTSLRNINEFKLRHIASGDTIRIYAVHLKASTGSANEQQRADEVTLLRNVTNALPAGTNFIVCGDFNFYSSNEPGYQSLLQIQSGNEGHVYDPISITGTWNNPAYAQYHTQSPRIRSFGGGVTGGMDDRFDMILYSKGIQDPGGITYVNGSTFVFGNDGNHYNDSINRLPNTAVSSTIANALHNASDHLPVISSFSFTLPGSAMADVGVSSFVAPSSSCPALKTLQVKLKNFSNSTHLFSVNPVTVRLKAVSPTGDSTVFLSSVSSGSLISGAELTVAFNPDYSMLLAGVYNFTAYSILSGDALPSNDAMLPINYTIPSITNVAVLPVGPIALCNGNSTVISGFGGGTYSWSSGSTSSAITVSTAGSYTLSVTNAGCTVVLPPVIVTTGSNNLNDTLFKESIGIVGGTTSIDDHETNNGFDNDNLTMTGTGDVRITAVSGGYLGASGNANVFITNIAGRSFTISGINTLNKSNLQLSFGIHKSTVASTGADFKVQVSADGLNFTDLSFPALPSGAGWNYRTATGTIPAVSNLRIRFINTASSTQYRIDDVVLVGSDVVTTVVNSCGPYLWNGNLYSQSGTYQDTLISSTGCDSIAVIQLSVRNNSTGNETVSACDSYLWHGNLYAQSGTYFHTMTSANGCDSVISLFLTILNSNSDALTVSTCEPYTWNGNTYTVSGIYSFQTINVNGCDSIVVLNLTIGSGVGFIAEISSSEPTFSFCPGSFLVLTATPSGPEYSYQWSNGDTTANISVSQPGNLTVSVSNSNGCTNISDPVFITYRYLSSDFDQNGITNVSDFLNLISAFNLNCTGCPEDLNSDGLVSTADFLLFNSEFGLNCQ